MSDAPLLLLVKAVKKGRLLCVQGPLLSEAPEWDAAVRTWMKRPPRVIHASLQVRRTSPLLAVTRNFLCQSNSAHVEHQQALGAHAQEALWLYRLCMTALLSLGRVHHSKLHVTA